MIDIDFQAAVEAAAMVGLLLFACLIMAFYTDDLDE